MKINHHQWTDINTRLEEAIKLITKDTTSLEKFYSIKKIIQGLDKKTDRTLEECSRIASRLEKLNQGKVVDIVFEYLPENTKEDKERKKLLLLFLKYYRELKSEVIRLKNEYQNLQKNAKEKNLSESSESFSRILLKAKGPFGLITLAVAIILAGVLLLPKKDKQAPTQNIIQNIEISPKQKIKAIKFQENYIPLDQLRIGIGSECTTSGEQKKHYHAQSGSTVTATDGTGLVDPGGCGFGKTDDITVLEIEYESNK